MRLFALPIFVSAFLLFQVQPLIGKYILPWFGSSPSVWTTSLLFFQVVLLAGYTYAHFIASRVAARRQVHLHLALLAGAVILLPIIPSESWKPGPEDDPTGRILLLLTASIGAPYLLLASTTPLLQAWFVRLHPNTSPYRLYAVSNTGSLLALLTYPFFFERFLHLQTQLWGWSIAFAAVAGLCAWRLWTAARQLRESTLETAAAATHDGEAAPSWLRLLLWLALAAGGSVVLLATTNQLSQNVPAVPFLFILPLSLYLLTFIICFDHERWYQRTFFTVLLPLVIAGGYAARYTENTLGLIPQILLFSTTLFGCCMSCHGELERLKPGPKHLTLFYLMVSLGGALGGVFVALAAPLVFDGYWEYEIGLTAIFGLVMTLVGRDMLRASRDVASAATVALTQTGAPKRERRKRGRSAGLLKKASWEPPHRKATPRWLGAAMLAASGTGVGLIGLFSLNSFSGNQDLLIQERGFYGVLQVQEALASTPRVHSYKLYHGTILHGFQYRVPEQRSWPTMYYGRNSGVGIAIRAHPARSDMTRPFHVGVIGLGAGTLAAYANDAMYRESYQQADDHFVFYEIDSLVIDLANRFFSFVSDARARGAKVEILPGDARIVMEEQLRRGNSQQFDVLVADAFSGDAVPMHLLTKESSDLYWNHLRPDGILAIHISSRYLDLLPVVRTLADLSGKDAVYIRYEGDRDGPSSRWVLVTSNQAFLSAARVQEARIPLGDVRAVLWTDDYSSLFDVIP